MRILNYLFEDIKEQARFYKRLEEVFDKFTITVKEFGEAMNKIKWEGDEKLWQ